MGKFIKDVAYKADKETKYSIMGYKFDETTVFLTTTDPDIMFSKRAYRSELNELKAWMINAEKTPVFDQTHDEWYVHMAASMPGYMHFRDKADCGYIYTYVPCSFVNKL